MQRILFFTLLITCCSIASAQVDSAKTLADAVVTGKHRSQTLKNSVYAVRVIKEKLRLSGAANIGEVLNTELGFRFNNDRALGISNAELNGMSGRNVKILLDGVPVSDRFDERVSLSQIDVNTIDRIEVVEGPMSVSYGTDAMAGTINIITKKNAGKGWKINLKAQEETAGKEYHPFSFKGKHIQSAAIDYGTRNWNFSAGGSHNDFSGFGGDQYGRQKTWLPKEQYFGNAKIGYSRKGWNAYYRFDGMNEELIDRNEVFIDPDIPRALATDQRFITNRLMHQVQSNLRVAATADLTSYLSFSNLERITQTTVQDFINQTSAVSKFAGTQDTSKLFSLGFKNTLSWAVSEKLSFQPGVDINYEKAGGARMQGTPDITDAAVFASVEYKPWERVNLRPGLRFLYNSRYDAPTAIPSLNTKFGLGNALDLRLAYGNGFRAPALREMYFIFVDASHNIVGNPDLKAEASNSFTGSLTKTLEAKSANITASLSGFYNSFRNQIDLAENAAIPTQYRYFNIDRTKTAGGALNTTVAVNNWRGNIGVQVTGYNRVFAEDIYKDDDRKYLWSPELTAGGSYTLPKYALTFAAFYKMNGKRPAFTYQSIGTTPGLYISQTAAYHTADLSLTKGLFKFFTVNAGVKNLFDVRDVRNNSLLNGSIHNTNGPVAISYGRTGFVALQFNFSTL